MHNFDVLMPFSFYLVVLIVSNPAKSITFSGKEAAPIP